MSRYILVAKCSGHDRRRKMSTVAWAATPCFAILALMAFPLEVSSQTVSDAPKFHGTVVTVDDGASARIAGAKLTFQSRNGTTKTVETDSVGEYAASLTPGEDYTLTASAKGFCPVHRPSFRTVPNTSTKFDFVLTTNCPRDRIASGPDAMEAYFASPTPHYFEENVRMGEGRIGHDLVIGFGRRRKSRDVIEYSGLSVGSRNEAQLSVTISFRTYTVKADHAVFNEKSQTLRVEGSVSIADGSDAPSKSLSCATLELSHADSQFLPCQKNE